MSTLTELQETLEYIDAHITDTLNADHLASRAGFSTFHFSKLFQWGVGYSIMNYVRSRRLAFAASELQSGRRILDIALDYGFETHSGFSKAFRRYFHCSPETYRLHAHYTTPLLPNLLIMNKYQIGGIIMEPKFVTYPAFKLAGYVLETTSVDGENSTSIPAFWTAYIHDGRMKKLHAEPFLKNHSEYGACFPEDPKSGKFEYLIGMEFKDNAVIPSEYAVRELPPATYAVFSTPPSDDASFVSNIQGTWNFIFNEWFPSSRYEYAPNCCDFELYDDRCMTASEKVCDIYIPVVKKQ